MRVRERVGRDLVAFELAEDAPPGMARAGVDQHVTHQVHVDPVRREPAQHVQAVGEALHLERILCPSVQCNLGGAAGASTLVACCADPTLARTGRPRLPARARRARAGQHGEARPALPGLPARQPLERARRRAAGGERLGRARAQHRPGPPRCTPTSAPACTRGGRSASRTRPCRAGSGACACRSTTRTSPTRPLPDPATRADRGRAQLRRRPPRDRRGPRPLPPVRAVRGLPAGGRQALARRLGRGLEPALEPARAPRLDVGGRRRPADPARPRPLRGGAPRRDRPCAALHGPAHAARVRVPGAPLRLQLQRSGPAADGPARAAARRASTHRASRARRGSC